MHYTSFLVLVLFSIFILVTCDSSTKKDVCIIGGGASGAMSAVFLKDRGYNVVVFEKWKNLGGHCDSVSTPGKGAGYIEAGVQVFSDTLRATQNGRGTFSIDSRTLVKRFVPSSLVFDIDYTQSLVDTTLIDLATGYILPPPDPTTLPYIQQAIANAFARLYGFSLQYPWLNTGKRPDPIPNPSIFFSPFTDFINQYDLWPLTIPVLNTLLYGSGIGPLENITTLEALQAISPMVLDPYMGPGAAFAVGSSCQSLYDGVYQYLGVDNVVFNVDIDFIQRPNTPTSQRPIVVKGSYKNEFGFDVEFNYKCEKVINAIYPLIQNIDPIYQLSNEEYSLFSEVEAHYYLAMAINFTGGSFATTPTASLLYNINASNQPSMQTNLPSLSIISKPVPGGFAGAWANADGVATLDEMMVAVNRDLSNIPPSLIENPQVIFKNLHLYSPHFSTRSLLASPSADTRLRNLQGQQGTYWVGAAVTVDSSTLQWNQAYELISANFPNKNK